MSEIKSGIRLLVTEVTAYKVTVKGEPKPKFYILGREKGQDESLRVDGWGAIPGEIIEGHVIEATIKSREYKGKTYWDFEQTGYGDKRNTTVKDLGPVEDIKEGQQELPKDGPPPGKKIPMPPPKKHEINVPNIFDLRANLTVHLLRAVEPKSEKDLNLVYKAVPKLMNFVMTGSVNPELPKEPNKEPKKS